MTDKEYREQKKRVESMINKWFKPMGMGWFDILFDWHRDERKEPTRNNIPAVADVECSWEYKRAKINWYLPVIQNIDDDELENMIVHEFVHILINSVDIEELPNEKLEYATESVARALIWVKKSSTPAA